uniref:3-beta hydroxysteroid dehydrogenase/isomerase domain-containing protein n=1 Tax=Clastoptera arizonana TaxID=38151 RepID=A0A1B6E4D6_9HEMI
MQANGFQLQTGQKLRTIALRPTIMYGEEDKGYLTKLLDLGDIFDGSLIRIGGVGGKQQLCYAGNAAWAHIVAKDELNNSSNTIEGLPVFITDESQIVDNLKFCERTIKKTDGSKCYNTPWWYFPIIISYYLAMAMEFFMDKLYPHIIPNRLPISPTGTVAYLSSLILYNGLRASIHLNYEPIYKTDVAYKRASKYYSERNLSKDEYFSQSCKYLSKDYKYVEI